VLSLQRLHIGQVLAVVIAGDDGILLVDPGDGLVYVTVEALYFVGAEETLLPLGGVLAQAVPGVVDLLLLGADLRDVRVGVNDQLVGTPVQLDHLVLVVGEVLLELFVLLLQNLDVLQIDARLLRVDERLLVVDPEDELVTVAHKLDKAQGLLQAQVLRLQAAL